MEELSEVEGLEGKCWKCRNLLSSEPEEILHKTVGGQSRNNGPKRTVSMCATRRRARAGPTDLDYVVHL